MAADFPSGTLTINVPDRAERDRVYGEYMNAWSRVENLVRVAIAEMLQIDDWAMRAIGAAVPTYNTINLFVAAAKLTLNTQGVSKAKKIHERLIDRNRRRNNIVHGCWHIYVSNPQTGEAEWLLQYSTIDAEITAAPHTDPKVAALYSFTVAELSQTTIHAEKVVISLSEFLAEIPSLKLQAPPSGK